MSQVDYDVIVAIATLHHMDIEAALEKMKLLLRPSGKLLVLGLYQEKTLIDYAYSAISIPLNFVYLKWYRASIAKPTTAARTRPA
ncbi:MAG: class I SAM-dependent methyltransferase [Leptolyngbyaceae cyanobacterium SM1_4_3]|nr:class I SAM-dependent methyltransferase [Leptolyngbyaceae cyanobacterium SM1_4_3]NJN89356.1 class I SAM-dependent methyltransferase [Leptolyngbyaceae cyanobacterium SL_5_14]